MKKIFFLLFLLFIVNYIHSESIHIFDYNISNYPLIKAKVFAVDDYGIPIQNIELSDFRISENNIDCVIQNIITPNQNTIDKNSLLLMYDLGLDSSLFNNFYNSIQIGQILIERVQDNSLEIGISSFDFFSYMNKDLELKNTPNTTTYISILHKLQPTNASNYEIGFFENKVGAVDILKKSKYKKNIIFFSDGIIKYDYQKIISKLNEENIRVFTISFSDTISNTLKEIALQTGGTYFYNINSLEEVKRTGEILISYLYNFEPNEISWNSIQDCNSNHKSTIYFDKIINGKQIQAKKKFEFLVPEKFKPSIECIGPDGKSYLRFSSVLPGKSKDLELKITPTNGQILISKFLIENPAFKVVNGDISNNLLLNPLDTHRLTIRFTPTDSAIEFSQLKIISNACYGADALITGGFPNKEPKPGKRTLKILNPKFNDALVVNDSIYITWTGLLPADVIQLEFSKNDGLTFDTLAYDINSGNEKTMEHLWKIPNIISDSCRIRAIQLWPNNIGQTLDLRHNSVVNCATFNKEGTLVATCVDDSMAYIWNSNNGKLLNSLYGHSKLVNWIEFDNLENSKYVITASDDHTAIIFNVSDGSIHKKLNGHKDRVNSCKFNENSDQVITSSVDGKVLRWDVATGKLLDTLVNGSSIQYATYTPDYKYLCVVYNSDVKLIDITTKKVVKTYKMNEFGNQHVSINKDQTLLSVSSKTGKVGVFDLNTEQLKYLIKHNDSLSPVNASSFSDDGTVLLTAGLDFKVKMWNTIDGSKHGNTFDEHLNSVKTAFFNFDKSRVLSASWDSTAKIWKLDKKDIQIDTTGRFRIGIPDIQLSNVNFGNVLYNCAKDSTIYDFIINKKDFPFQIQKYSIVGDNAENFEIKEYFTPYNIESNDTIKIRIRFTPKSLGLKKAQFEVLYEGGNKIVSELSGNGVNPALEASMKLIDFGYEEVGEFKDSSITILAKNISNKEINIDKMQIEFPDSLHFKLISDPNIKVKPNSNIAFKLRYIPEFIRRDNGVLVIYHDGEFGKTKVNLYGEGLKGTIDTIHFYIDPSEASIGDSVIIPIKFKNASEFVFDNGLSGFEFSIQYNSTILEPKFNYNNLFIENNLSTIIFNTENLNKNNSILKELKFNVGLGNDTISRIKILDVTPIGNSRIKIYFDDSYFKLNGLCKEGKTRLFYSDNRISLQQNVPNPVTNFTSIEFEILEPGNSKIIITDVLGNIVKEIINETLSPGKYQVNVDCSQINPGIYNYFLITPTQKLIKKLQVIK